VATRPFARYIQFAEPALDLRERARLRAEIDAIVAGLYNPSPAEFGYIRTTFLLLDRDQPPLPDDFFVRWNKQGKPKLEPRSYITRDTRRSPIPAIAASPRPTTSRSGTAMRSPST
jgi:hypothetical protein